MEQRGRDAFGQISYESYITSDTTLTRRLVLTAEGPLVVHDVLTPGSSMAGWTAGQLWQLYELKSQGADWFAIAEDGTYPLAKGEARPLAMLVR